MTTDTEPQKNLVADADGTHCRYCDETSEGLSGAEYITFWDVHEARKHKLVHIRNGVGRYPDGDVLGALLDVLGE